MRCGLVSLPDAPSPAPADCPIWSMSCSPHTPLSRTRPSPPQLCHPHFSGCCLCFSQEKSPCFWNSDPAVFHFKELMGRGEGPGQVAPLAGASSGTPKVAGLIPGHCVHERQPTDISLSHACLPLSTSPSLPLPFYCSKISTDILGQGLKKNYMELMTENQNPFLSQRDECKSVPQT